MVDITPCSNALRQLKLWKGKCDLFEGRAQTIERIDAIKIDFRLIEEFIFRVSVEESLYKK